MQPPAWTDFDGRWGQYEKLLYSYYTPDHWVTPRFEARVQKNVAAGPVGPKQHGTPLGSDFGIRQKSGVGVTTTDRRPYVFLVVSDDHLELNWLDPEWRWTTAWRWEDFGTSPGATVADRVGVTTVDRRPYAFVIGSDFYTLVSPKRLRKIAVITKASALLRLHQALVKRKYHLRYGSHRPRRPGPKGQSSELIAAVIEMKRRNPRIGRRKIAKQISSAFGIEIDKDVVVIPRTKYISASL